MPGTPSRHFMNKQIKVKTIKECAFAAASLLVLFSGVDFRYDAPLDKTFGSHLAPVYADLERYETVPERREPCTPAMHKEAERIAAPLQNSNPLTLIPALVDGFAMALLTGFRLSEWAQHPGCTNPLTPQQNHLLPPNVLTRALCPVDLRVETSDFQRLTGLDVLSVPLTSIRKMWLTYRTQKNGHHGEERLCTRNPDPQGHCFVAAAYSCLSRFRSLQKLEPGLTPTSPLCCYWHPSTSSVRLITATDVEDFMRSLAVTVYDLHPVKNKAALQKWSSHSLCVGACILLHAMGFTPLDIQWLLRWRSNAFMAYLRNLAGLADCHHQAVDRAGAMPHIF